MSIAQRCIGLVVVAFLLPSLRIRAQNATSYTATPFARSAIAAASAAMTTTSPDPSTETLLLNRARVFKNEISASGVRYWSLVDSDLNGKTTDQVLQRLSPTAITGGRVREVDIVVDLRKPLTVFTKPGEVINIGSELVSGADVRTLTVTSIISMSGLTIISK